MRQLEFLYSQTQDFTSSHSGVESWNDNRRKCAFLPNRIFISRLPIDSALGDY